MCTCTSEKKVDRCSLRPTVNSPPAGGAVDLEVRAASLRCSCSCRCCPTRCTALICLLLRRADSLAFVCHGRRDQPHARCTALLHFTDCPALFDPAMTATGRPPRSVSTRCRATAALHCTAMALLTGCTERWLLTHPLSASLCPPAFSHTHSRSTELASNGTAVAATAVDDSTAPAAVWMADAQSAECVLCCRAFTLMLRRHHW